VTLNPNDPHILAVLALFMHFDGRFEESVTLGKKRDAFISFLSDIRFVKNGFRN